MTVDAVQSMNPARAVPRLAWPLLFLGNGVIEYAIAGQVTLLTFGLLLVSFMVLGYARIRRADRVLATLFLVALGIRLVFFLASNTYFDAIGFEHGSPAPGDPVSYSNIGWDLAKSWETGVYEGETILYGSLVKRHMYYLYNGVLYSILGDQIFHVPVIINVILGALAVVLAAACASAAGLGVPVQRLAAVLVMADPHLIVMNGTNLKESWLAVALLVSLLGWLRFYPRLADFWNGAAQRFRQSDNGWIARLLPTRRQFLMELLRPEHYPPLVLLITGLLIMGLLRPVLAGVMFAAIAATMANAILRRFGLNVWLRLLAAFLVGVVLVYAPTPIGALVHAYVEGYAKSMSLGTGSGNSLFAVLGGASVLERPWLIPIVMMVSLLGAFPAWRLDATLWSELLRAGTVWLHLLVPFIVLAMRGVLRGRLVLRADAGFFALVMGYWLAVTLVTLGTPEALRYLAPLHPVLLIYAAMGLQSARPRMIPVVITVYMGLIGAMGAAYYLLKLLLEIRPLLT